MSEIVTIPANDATVSRGNCGTGGIKIKATMTIDQMQDAVRSIAAAMPGDCWKELMAEVNNEEICHNCGTAMPEGCGGLFRKDGDECMLNREK